MSEIYIAPIGADKIRAQAMLDIKYADLIRSGLNRSRALEVSNPNSSKHLDAQIESLQDNMMIMRYLGAFACDKMLGYVDICRLDKSDKLPIDGFTWEFSTIRAAFKGYPIVINDLIAVDSNKEVISELLKRAHKVTDCREAFIAIDRNNPIQNVREFIEFESTGKYGESDGIRKELYIRYPYLKFENLVRNSVPNYKRLLA